MFPLLETLVAVYEVGQFTLAADELKVSQSTVSSRIAQLEQMVGAPLFVRNAKSDVTPTQAGRMLYQTAIGIDGLWRDTREQIARVQEAREPLAVSFSHTTAAILLPKALPVMARDMDGFDFAVHVMNSDAILEQASMKAVQLGVVEKPIVNDSVDRVTLCESKVVEVVLIVNKCICKAMEVSSNAAIVAALSAGFGQSLISEAAVPAGVPVQRELGDEFVRRFYALVPRSGLTHDQRELAETIIAALRG